MRIVVPEKTAPPGRLISQKNYGQQEHRPQPVPRPKNSVVAVPALSSFGLVVIMGSCRNLLPTKRSTFLC